MEFICNQCPRRCGALRTEDEGAGYCAAPALPKLARAALHFWEEPVVSGTRGSGTIFFSGCALGCVYCQNDRISHDGYGKTVSISRLAEIIRDLERQGAHNINLVNPTHYAHLLPLIREHTPEGLPIIYNTGGYESEEALSLAYGNVDIYLVDIKYHAPALSAKLSDARDYFAHASKAVEAMFQAVGPAVIAADGLLRRGVIVRHLVLPGYSADSLAVLRYCKEHLPEGILYSIMSQYTPIGRVKNMPPLHRRLKSSEYKRVQDFVEEHDAFSGFIQELSSAEEEFVPPFDLTGV